MMGVEKEDWNELIRILKDTEESITALSTGDPAKEIPRSRQSIQAFHVTAAMLGLGELERTGLEFEKFLNTQVGSGKDKDSAAVLGFAISMLADEIQQNLKSGNGAAKIDLSEILDMLGVSMEAVQAPTIKEELPPPVAPAKKKAAQPAPAPAATESRSAAKEAEAIPVPDARADELNACRFAKMIKSLGGEIAFSPNGKSGAKFSVTFSGSAESLKKLDALLASDEEPAPDLGIVPIDEKTMQKIIGKGQEIMAALSNGEIARAQDILLGLADQQQAGLYKEIGGLARGLHDSIRNFINTMDPSLKEMVEDQIPDSGNRLEHMLELTERAANTTIDNVEAMQDRFRTDHENLERLGALLRDLRPLGDQAVRKLSDSEQIIAALEETMRQHRVNLDTIVSAQDFQDLSGQIILKIITLLHDIEQKLVNVIRTFGVKIEAGKKKKEDDLYGPAHTGRDDAVHSQDEVDQLLAEFGF